MTVDDAMSLWFAGDFDRCLELCEGVRAPNLGTQTHVAFLRARALMRLLRPLEALETLRRTPPAPHDSDEAITALMLCGEAHVRSGNAAEGLRVLREAQQRASAVGAHPTIVAEVTMNVGLAHYTLRDFDAADAVLQTVAEDADLVSARAVQFRAWVASARGECGEAVTLFMRALALLDACRHQDRFFEANCTRALAHLAFERLDPRTWAFVAERRARIDWSYPALAPMRFYIAYCAAGYQIDVEGDALEGAREARLAEQTAPSAPLIVQGRCRRAWVARSTGEANAHRDHVDSAAELFAGLDATALAGDDQVVPLIVAEELISVRPRDAEPLVRLFEGLAPMSPLRLMKQSALGDVYHALVEGLVLEAAGDRAGALRRYRAVFGAYRDRGYVRRAVMTAERLWALTGEATYAAYMAHATNDLSPRSFLRQRVEAARQSARRLTTVQREVLMLICQGKSNPEIARLRKRSLHTIRNLVARLFEIFEVTSREELAVECVRRGLYSPAERR
ncbi:MAG TPA: LuxR C-terminal-related transcriptional regulator [Candidatus Elarobacter sp.]